MPQQDRTLDLVIRVHSESSSATEGVRPNLAVARMNCHLFELMLQRVEKLHELHALDDELIELGYLYPNLKWLVQHSNFNRIERLDAISGANIVHNLEEGIPSFLNDPEGHIGTKVVEVQAGRIVINRERIYWEGFMKDNTQVITDDVSISLLTEAYRLLCDRSNKGRRT